MVWRTWLNVKVHFPTQNQYQQIQRVSFKELVCDLFTFWLEAIAKR